MNPADRSELEALRREQARVQREMDELDARIETLGRRLESEPPAKVVRPSPVASKPALEPSMRREPPPLPPPAMPKAQPAPASAALPPSPAPPPHSDSIELRLGMYWLARIGIVILLTGLVFLGNYAYQRFVPLLGAGGRLALLALAGAVLAGIGRWLERSRESMRNYGRVLLAGGAATFYYTAYAAHFVERLRVIESPLVGGLLLLALTGAIVWFAERRGSEPTALLAVLLAYYTSAINSIGGFTLFSNLLLTAAAVLLLLRQRWVLLSCASLAATYGSYGFWRFHSAVTTGVSGAGEFGMALGFLAGYWALFTVAVFVVDRATFPAAQRSVFLTANNGAFFAFAAQHYAAHRPGAFWMFALGFGAVLLILAALAARRRAEDRAMDGAYLAQGLALVTVGLAAKLTGPQLAATLAVESAVLMNGARWRHGWLYQIAAGLTAAAAFVLALGEIQRHPASALALGGPVTALLIFDAWWLKHLRGELAGLRIGERAVGFALLALGMVGVVIWHAVAAPWQPVAFAAAAVVCAVSIRALRLPEVSLPGQAFLGAAIALFFVRHFDSAPAPWWQSAALIAMALGLVHWWQHQRIQPLGVEARTALQLGCAAVAAACGTLWLDDYDATHGDRRLVVTSSVALGSLVYGLGTRAWSVAAVGQWFTFLSVQTFAIALLYRHPAWAAALAPIGNLALTALLLTTAATGRLPALRQGATFGHLALFYRIAASVLFAFWGWEYVTAPWRIAFFAGLGAVQMLAACALRDRERLAIGAVYAVAGLVLYWLGSGANVAWQNLAAIVVVPASLRLGGRLAGDAFLPAQARNALVAAALASVWLWVTRYTFTHGHAGQLTAAWALLALVVFAAGLGLRERVYRVGGFAILALAIGRLFFVDVWKLETIFRIVSFLILGAVLLLLGFVYNRYAETIRRWL